MKIQNTKIFNLGVLFIVYNCKRPHSWQPWPGAIS